MDINEELTDKLIDIAKQAGEAVMEIYSLDDIGITRKKDHSPLTLADSASDEIIKQNLGALFPDIPLLSEESVEIPYEKRKSWKRFWLIDPLDGTKEFIKRNGEFTINIALIEGNEPALGVVYAPAKNILYYGAKGLGAYKLSGMDKKKIKVREYINGEKLVMTVSQSNYDERAEKFIRDIEMGNIATDIIKMGSSLKFCLVAEGITHIYPRFGPTMEWDTAAAHAVVEAAGGKVTDLGNKPLRYNKENMLNPDFIVSGRSGFKWENYI